MTIGQEEKTNPSWRGNSTNPYAESPRQIVKKEPHPLEVLKIGADHVTLDLAQHTEDLHRVFNSINNTVSALRIQMILTLKHLNRSSKNDSLWSMESITLHRKRLRDLFNLWNDKVSDTEAIIRKYS